MPVSTQDLDAHHAPLQAALAAAAVRVLQSGRYISGAEVAGFEAACAEALGAAHAVAVSSGTDALLASLMALGVGPGDEVVTTPLSFFATVAAIVRLGARPVFADIDEATCNLDDGAAAAQVGSRCRAAIPVHLFGRVASVPQLRARCAALGVPVLDDAAQAIGAVDAAGRSVGQLGTAATLSFFPSKNLGGFGDGGMVLTGDAELARRLRLLRAHGAEPKYHHVVVGGNFRMDELQAALLGVKLPHLPVWTAARRRLAERYREALTAAGPVADGRLALPPPDPGAVWNQYVVRVRGGQRDACRRHLEARGIATAVYYPEPLHLQPCLAALGYRRGELPVAERACAEALALPLYPEMPDVALDDVVAAVVSFFAG